MGFEAPHGLSIGVLNEVPPSSEERSSFPLFDIATGTTTLNDLYAPTEDVFVNPPVIRSMDGDHQWSDVSQRGLTQARGTGHFRYWEDCVARDFVFREIFLSTFTEVNDPRNAISDTVAPTTTQTPSGPQFVGMSGKQFLSSASTISLDTKDNFWTDTGKYPGLGLNFRLTASGDTPGFFALSNSHELDFMPSSLLTDGDYVFEWKGGDKVRERRGNEIPVVLPRQHSAIDHHQLPGGRRELPQ